MLMKVKISKLRFDKCMCEKCFLKEVDCFSSMEAFWALDLRLTQKIADEKTIELGDFLPDGPRGSFYQIYHCLYCGTDWKLSEPVRVGDGYFLLLENPRQ